MPNLPNTSRANRHRSSGVILIIGALLTVYFAHHAMYGRFGIEANRRLSAEAVRLTARQVSLEARRANLARDIRLLQGAAHPDMVEEAARRTLGFTHPGSWLIENRR